MSADLAPLSFDAVRPLVGQTFTLRSGATSTQMVLLEAKSLGRHRSGQTDAPESFSLLFRIPRNLRAAQGTYECSHPELGTRDIFLVPIAADVSGMQLQAIFNYV